MLELDTYYDRIPIGTRINRFDTPVERDYKERTVPIKRTLPKNCRPKSPPIFVSLTMDGKEFFRGSLNDAAEHTGVARSTLSGHIYRSRKGQHTEFKNGMKLTVISKVKRRKK